MDSKTTSQKKRRKIFRKLDKLILNCLSNNKSDITLFVSMDIQVLLCSDDKNLPIQMLYLSVHLYLSTKVNIYKCIITFRF
jgi:hypothetical protein